MIVNLRGTNGSGKSTIVRKIVDAAATEKITQPGRRHPLGYICRRRHRPTLLIPGHYEIANGGVDTLRSLDEAYGMIEAAANAGGDVLYEGKNMSDGCVRVVGMHLRGLDVRVIFLDTPYDACVRSVRARGHKISERTIRRLFDKSRRELSELLEIEVYAELLDREAALARVREWLL